MSLATLTKKPTVLTALLSASALVAYAAYRLAAPGGDADLRFAGEIPEFAFEDLAGAPATLGDYTDSAMLVNFWATWCAPCLREIPLLKSFHSEQDAIAVVGIALDRPEPVLEYAAGMEFNYPVLVGLEEAYEAMAFFENIAQAMPFSAFTAPGGALLGVHAGELHAEQLEHFAETVELLTTGAIGLPAARERLASIL